MIGRPPRSPLFPYPPLFRSAGPGPPYRIGHGGERLRLPDHAPGQLVLEVGETLALRLERSEEHTSELQSQSNLVCRLLLEKKKESTCSILSTHETSLISLLL